MVKICLGIDGMMCPMCEAHMNDAIRNSFDVKKVKEKKKKKSCVITAKEEIPREALEKVVAETGYKLTSYEVE